MLSTTLPLALLLVSQAAPATIGPPSEPQVQQRVGDEYRPQFSRTPPFRAARTVGGDSIAAAPLAARWMRDLWGQVVAGVDQEAQLTLVDAVEHGSATGQRLAALRAYWQLCGQMVLRDLAQDQLARIEELEPYAARQPDSLWTAIRDDARAHVRTAEFELSQAQLTAQMLMPASAVSARPVPVEGPYVGAYRTNFDTLFTGGAAPLGLRRLHETLPLELAAIEARAESVSTHTLAANAIAQSQSPGDLSRWLDVLERMGKQREMLVRMIVRYNEHIAEYAVAVGGSANDRTLAAMLIPSPIVTEAGPPLSAIEPGRLLPAEGVAGMREIRPVTAIEPLRPAPRQPISPQPLAPQSLAEQPPYSQPPYSQPPNAQPPNAQPLYSQQPLSQQPLSQQPLSPQPLSPQPLSPQPLSPQPPVEPSATFREVAPEALEGGGGDVPQPPR